MQEEYEDGQDLEYGLIDTEARINKWVTHFLLSYHEGQFETMNKCCNCIFLEVKANMNKEEKEISNGYREQIKELMKNSAVRYNNWLQSKKMMPTQTPPLTIDQNLEDKLINWFSHLKEVLKRLNLDLREKKKSGVI